MRTALLVALLFIPASAWPAQQSATPVAAPDALRRDMEAARKKVYPALVNISTVTRFFQGGRALRAPSAGSGVIVTPQGHVLTNFHVAGHSTRILCSLPNGESMEADVVVHDPLSDLSVLKLRLDKRPAGSALPCAAMGDSASLEVGDYVLAMGNPLTLSSSMTLGIVSNTKRVFTDFTGTEISDQDLDSGEKTGLFTRWIQHDALILPGNSGGPLVNLKGEVVGINELGSSGVGFAIPSNIASQVLRQALAAGKIRRGWLGIAVLPVDRLGLKAGALVSSILPDSPAERSGLKAGDILTALEDQPTNARFFEEVPLVYQKVAALEPGKTVTLHYTRDGSPHSATATVSAMQSMTGEEDEVRKVGVTVENITEYMALANRLPTRQGVLVTGVRPAFAFAAAKPAIDAGDIIVSVDGEPTASVKAFAAAFKGNKKEYVVNLRRESENLLSVVQPKDDAVEDEGGELPKAWLGIKTQVVTADLSRALKLTNAKGFRITEVFPATSAAKAGLEPGDIITALNGQKTGAYREQDADDLKHEIEELPIGSKAELGLLRSGKPLKLAVVLDPPPAPVDKAKRIKQEELEFTGRDITDTDRLENRWTAGQHGVLVTEVTSGGWAQIGGLHVDDVILSVNGSSTPNVTSFQAVMTKLFKEKPSNIRFFVLRGARTHFVFMDPDWSKLLAGASAPKGDR